jgi:hypothetical protein
MFVPSSSNMNFPAPLAVMAFLAAIAGFVLALASAAIAWFARKPKFARNCLIAVSAGAALYLTLLLGFSLASHQQLLTRSQEKYFCEIDCHLAYSLLDVKIEPSAATTHYQVTIRTRFDETTTSPSRPKDATLTPSPRTILLLDSAGHQYGPTAIEGTPLLTPLSPPTPTPRNSPSTSLPPPTPNPSVSSSPPPRLARPRRHRRRKQLPPPQNLLRPLTRLRRDSRLGCPCL